MDILIIANFCMDFTENENGRFSYLAKLLNLNNDVEVVTSGFYHITKERRTCEPITDYKVTLIDEPGYKKNVCLKRFYSHFIWGMKVYKYLKKRKTPDVIYCAIPSLTAPFLTAGYAKKKKIRFIVDIQDLWPEAFKMIFNVPIVSDVIFFPFTVMANRAYSLADEVIGVSSTYVDRAIRVSSKRKKGHPVFLGTELSRFDELSSKEPRCVSKSDGDIWLAYCGTLGSSYDIKCVIDAMELLDDVELTFIVMGDGPKMEEFQNYACHKNVNTVFLGRLQYNEMCSVLSLCDIAVNPIMHGAAQSIINKHADYAAAGLPIINTQESEEYRDLVDSYKMGFNCSNNDAYDMSEKIKALALDDELRRVMGKQSRKCAEDQFDRKKTYKKIVQVITDGR